MIAPIDIDKVKGTLFPAFQPIFSYIQEKYIQPSEQIFSASCCTHMEKYRLDYGKEPLRMSHTPSLLVISEHRWIRAGLRFPTSNQKEVVYRKSGSSLGGLFGADYFDWKWIELEYVFPSDADISESIFVRELALSKLQVTNRFEYKVNFKDQTLNLVEVAIDEAWAAFRESDGNTFYAAMQEAAKNNGRIQVVQEVIPFDPIEPFKKIKELFDLGLITETEYESKRQEILARL